MDCDAPARPATHFQQHYCNTFDDFYGFTTLFKKHAAQVDVLELFGGEAGVIKICLRRGLSSGGNVDLRTQWNLLTPRHVEAFERLTELQLIFFALLFKIRKPETVDIMRVMFNGIHISTAFFFK